MPDSNMKHANRLAAETSPYLLQHAHNPVDWYPWCEEAFARARAEDKPVFLSIGYAACHWCHVMERESFEDPALARVLNDHFVSVKVDREERPDLDAIFMEAVVAMTGSGGWPMSVFLTPERQPFFAGTYFPPEDRYGRPGFARILTGIASVWRGRRNDLLHTAAIVTAQLGAAAGAGTASTRLDGAPLSLALDALQTAYDTTHGGWGGAPKFPSAAGISLLLRLHARTGSETARGMAIHTLERMALGGMRDHAGGGFHRYSVDEEWRVPHFEKMLYDNAQLAVAYIEAWQVSGNEAFRRVACGTLDYLLRDLRDPAGGFHSSEDADSEGEEGRFYLWRRAEVRDILGEDAAAFAAVFDLREEGNFVSHEPYHRGVNVLHRAGGFSSGADEARIAAALEHLRTVREKRVRPGRDDKVLAAWNGLAIAAFARAAQVLGEERYRVAALEAGAFVRDALWRDGMLYRSWRKGKAGVPGFLDDYAGVANAFVDLYETVSDPGWLDAADQLMRAVLERFADPHGGGFHYAEAGRNPLLARPKPMHDGQEPSGNTAAALAFQRLAAHLDNAGYATRANEILAAMYPGMCRVPQAYLHALGALDFAIHSPVEIAIVAGEDEHETEALLGTAWKTFLPARVIAARKGPLLGGKTPVDGKAAAYVCRNNACAAPVVTAEALRALLEAR